MSIFLTISDDRVTYRDRINRTYIIKLLREFKEEKEQTESQAKKKAIIDLLGGDIPMISKRVLIEKFIDENLRFIHDADKIDDEFKQYRQDQKVLALGKLCDDENLDKAQFKALIDGYIFSGQEPIRD